MSEHYDDIAQKEVVVGDIVTDLFGAVMKSSSLLSRRSIGKRFSSPQRYICDIAQGYSLRRIIGENPVATNPESYGDDYRESMLCLVRSIGSLSLSMQSYAYDHYMVRRTLRVDGKRMSVHAFNDKVWAPDYTDRIVAATRLRVGSSASGELGERFTHALSHDAAGLAGVQFFPDPEYDETLEAMQDALVHPRVVQRLSMPNPVGAEITVGSEIIE